MVIVKLKSEESRRKILENKRKLRGKEIEEDQIFKEMEIKANSRRRGKKRREDENRIWKVMDRR